MEFPVTPQHLLKIQRLLFVSGGYLDVDVIDQEKYVRDLSYETEQSIFDIIDYAFNLDYKKYGEVVKKIKQG